MSVTVHEYAIYIHGVSKENHQKHTESYDTFHHGVRLVQGDFAERSAWENVNRCNIEWGWAPADTQPSPKGDALLADAQDQFSKRIAPPIQNARDWTLNPLRLLLASFRKEMIKGFSDMFYYCSRDGKNSIRATVAAQILQCIAEPLEKGEPISLTFLGHSAGSVIAFDFLFYLFASDETLKGHDFVEAEHNDTATYNNEDFKKLRELAKAQKLRIRRLITFGSPISMLAFRSNAVLQELANDRPLKMSDYGFDQNHAVFGAPLNGPRWINFWDKDDIIAWPVQPLMQDSPLIRDIYTNVGWQISAVHNQYWGNKKVHQQVAAYW